MLKNKRFSRIHGNRNNAHSFDASGVQLGNRGQRFFVYVDRRSLPPKWIVHIKGANLKSGCCRHRQLKPEIIRPSRNQKTLDAEFAHGELLPHLRWQFRHAKPQQKWLLIGCLRPRCAGAAIGSHQIHTRLKLR